MITDVLRGSGAWNKPACGGKQLESSGRVVVMFADSRPAGVSSLADFDVIPVAEQDQRDHVERARWSQPVDGSGSPLESLRGIRRSE